MASDESNMDDNASLILVMGVTGAGKSYFINQVSKSNSARVGASLASCTEQAMLIPATIGREKVILIDTPGFDDTRRSDTEILTEISRLLSAQYELGLKLKGVIYLHRITDVRMSGSAMKTLKICKRICGNTALKNVILVTNRWTGFDPSLGADREAELRDNFWKFMLNYGSSMMRYYDDQDSAIAIASQLLAKDTIVLDIQRELVDEGKRLNQTAAGSLVSEDIEALRSQHEQEMRELEALRSELRESDRQMREDVTKEWAIERERLRKTQIEQAELERPVGQEVQEEVKRKRKSLGKGLPFLPGALSLLGAFVGMSSGTFDALGSWFGDRKVLNRVATFIDSR